MKKKVIQKSKPKTKKEKTSVSKTAKPAKTVKAKAVKTVKTGKANKAAKAVKAIKTSKAGKSGKIMVQHLFKLQGNYKAPNGKVYRVVLSEVYNLRCFEVVNGNLVGPMVKIHPTSDLAKSLIEVTN
jgi:hypothetical protein